MPKSTRRSFLKTLTLGTVAGVAGAGYAQDCADWLSVERRDISLPNWSAGGFKIALLADLHMNAYHERVRAQRAIGLALDEKPDLLVVAGDFVNMSTAEALQNIKKGLEPLADAKCPCIGVLGNHDYWCPHPALVVAAVKDSPVRLLRNELFDIQGITVAGIDDAFDGLANYEFFPSHRVSKNCIAILHEPDYVSNIPKHVRLQLSGHTHGGQVCLPFGVAMHTPKGGRKYIAGYYPDAKVPLYVTRGVGTTGVGYRLFCRPEVSILTLRPA